MPTSSRKGKEEKNKTSKFHEKSASFHGQIPTTRGSLRRPKTSPDLFSGRDHAGISPEKLAVPPRLTKLLLNVTLQRSLGPVQVLISPESTVGDLITLAVQQYVKEGRRPLLPETDPSCFDLHYSQFSLESLDRNEKLIGLGSRNFFMCPRAKAASGSCSNEAEKGSKTTFGWLKIVNLLL